MKSVWIFCIYLSVAILVSARPNDEKDLAYDGDGDGEILNDFDGGDDYEDQDEEDDYDAEDGPPPVIITRPLGITAMPGETVWLPCDTKYADSFAIMWKKNGTLIFQEKIEVGLREPRYTLHSNQTLQIKTVLANDSAEYECSVSTSPEPTKIIHTLTVLTPARIVTVSPRDGKKEIKAGGVLELVCVADGNPRPKITWSKEGSRVHDKHGVYETPTITIENVGRDNAGFYQCMADNKVGQPAVAPIEIIVTHAPIIKIEKITVNKTETHLICIVHGTPEPKVIWKTNDTVIAANDNMKLGIIDHHNHVLVIKDTEKSFGTYTCSATNKIGHKEKHVVLNGKPSLARHEKSEFVGDNNDVRLEWTVESASPIIEYQLQYKMKEPGTTWNDEKPKVSESEGVTYIISHVIQNLKSGVYESRLRSRNKFGWSQYSQIVSFEGKSVSTESLAVSENREEPYNSNNGGLQTVSTLSISAVLVMWLCTRFV